ncbi:hypothetical protein PUN28_000341 [Cardiocondyla obscurior]|uniref:Uncharacterized protein n=1 Tax=Cardiocondyla obscurior TaxID=286306 RepID=A0AAW2GYY2_9HYME
MQWNRITGHGWSATELIIHCQIKEACYFNITNFVAVACDTIVIFESLIKIFTTSFAISTIAICSTVQAMTSVTAVTVASCKK